MRASDHGQAYHGVLVHSDQPAGLAYPATLLQVLQDREGLLVRKPAAVQRRALALRKASLAGATGQDPAFFIGAIAEAHAQVVAAALAVVGARGVLAAEGFQVVHDSTSRFQRHGKGGQPLGLT